MRKTETVQARSEDLLSVLELEPVAGELFILEAAVGSPGELRAVSVPVFRRVVAPAPSTKSKKKETRSDDLPASDQ